MLPIPDFLAPTRVFAKVLNGLLGREQWAADCLARHEAKTIRFYIGTQSLCLTIVEGGLVEVASRDAQPHITLTLTTHQLGQVLQAVRQGNTNDVAHFLHVEGDAGLATVVAELARTLRWDPEEDLARFVGDAAAVRIGSCFRAFLTGVQRSSKRFAGNMAEYLVEERDVLLGRRAHEAWSLQLRDLHVWLDRLDEKVVALETHGRVNRNGGGR
ncbi:MAG: SCP2 sterol-binding domain-containing protein [Pusillimonas sp.]|nr:SCP2 sterol-binding domain-containing protein [Pusillimonas sp.]